MQSPHPDLPPDMPEFRGHIARTREASTPWWPPRHRARAGSPNIVLIYMDDLGFADVGCYGSEIATPHIDALAARGQRFNHYTTHPVCSAARAALLTGRNAHAVGTGWLASNNPGYPGYSGDIPLDAPTLPETLRAAGYATIAVGKWHNASDSATPNASWPIQRGFDQFYGFLAGETSYFHPHCILIDNSIAPIDSYPPGYYATDDWTTQGMQRVRTLRANAPDKPFFLYVAYNAVHGPLQARQEDLDRYAGVYDAGWDDIRARRFARQKELGLIPADTRLSPRDPSVPAWEQVPDDQRALFARHMQTYAAMLDRVDQNVGRIVEALRDMGELDNTIIVFSSDNGGTSAAGPTGVLFHNRFRSNLPRLGVEHDMAHQDWVGTARGAALYPTGWAQASNTPFPNYKNYTGGGGRRVSLVVSWPAGLGDEGVVRPQFAHVTDLMPTLLDLAGVAPLAQSHGQPARPPHGASLAAVLRANAPAPRDEQYYECWSARAFYRAGWVAVSVQQRGRPIDFDNWTLHHHTSDYAEVEDLAARHPGKLRELVEAFDKAAWNNLVYPLDNRTALDKFNQMAPGARPPAKTVRRFVRDTQTVHLARVMPLLADRCFRIVAAIEHRPADQGVLFAIGEYMGGMVLYIEDSALRLSYNGFGETTRLPPLVLPAGTREVTLEFEATGGRQGRARLLASAGVQGPWSMLAPTLMMGMHEGLDIGIDRRAPVDWELHERHGSFPYTGTLTSVHIEAGDHAPDSPLRPD